MDPVDADSPSNAPAPAPDLDSARSARLDTWLSYGVWAAGICLVLLAGYFGYSVYAQQQASRLATPALQVVDAVRKLVQASPQDPQLRSRLAEALATAGQLDEAKQELYVALKLDAKYIGAYQNLATIELQQKDYTNSVVHWKKVLDLTTDAEMQNVNDRRELAYFNLGQIALIQKDYVGAVGYFNAAIRIRKDASDTYLLLAKAYQGLEQNDQAMEQINTALAFDPNYAEAHHLRGKLYMAAGDTVDAAWDFRMALDGAPDNPEAQAAMDSLGSYESWYGKAATAWTSSEASAALDAVRIARAIQPDSYDAAMLHGQILERTGDAAGAVDAYTVALKAKPDDPAATAALKRAKAASKE
jgi:tetratricopeptide (TPR) repeat protein